MRRRQNPFESTIQDVEPNVVVVRTYHVRNASILVLSTVKYKREVPLGAGMSKIRRASVYGPIAISNQLAAVFSLCLIIAP
jgi:hypothetical protein